MSRLAAIILALFSAASLAETRVFTWDSRQSWPAGTTIELSANGVTQTGISGTQYTLDIPLDETRKIYAKARAVGVNGDVSDWATYATVAPAIQSAPSKALWHLGGTSMSITAPWANQDIGSVTIAGSADYSAGTYTVSGSGQDVWVAADEFHFVYMPLNGDGSIVARIASVTNQDFYTKAGVMIRETLNANSKNAFMAFVYGQGPRFQKRVNTGGSTDATAAPATNPGLPYWVKITRAGNVFTGYQSADGATWTQVSSGTISMSTSAYVGLALTSHNVSKLSTATITNVEVVEGAGGAALSSAATVAATASGAVSTAIPILSAATAVQTATGSLSVSAALIDLASSASVVVGATGGMSVLVSLAGDVITNALASASLSVASGSMSGDAIAESTAHGGLSVSVLLSGAAFSEAVSQAVLSQLTGLSGGGQGAVTAAGDLQSVGAAALLGTASVVAGATGNLGIGIPIEGFAQGSVSASGALVALAPISGEATVTALAGGNVQVTIATVLSGAAMSAVAAGGSLAIEVPLSGSAVGRVFASGILEGGTVAWMPAPSRTWVSTYVPRVWRGVVSNRVWRSVA